MRAARRRYRPMPAAHRARARLENSARSVRDQLRALYDSAMSDEGKSKPARVLAYVDAVREQFPNATIQLCFPETEKEPAEIVEYEPSIPNADGHGLMIRVTF